MAIYPTPAQFETIVDATELLVDQHYNTFNKLLASFGVRTVLLKGSMTAKQNRDSYTPVAK